MSAREPRDTGEQRTRADAVDFDTYAVPDGDTTESPGDDLPRATPDHGVQPRRPKRPTYVAWRRDPTNRYRPADDETAKTHLTLNEVEHQRLQIVRLLTKTARAHAPKLARRTDDAVSELIKTEVLLDAVWIANSLPPDAIARVMNEFLDVLWAEIEQHRRKNKITKT